ncbi:Zinc finger protein [Penicillium chrysogenum]|uniref:Zinc finger protein n=1 Tax=Penicillium chrysogenum TaxID=5076 RepID=A0A167UJ06_PENCH|nr:hypothetical protein NUH16_007078 [Penicillium rubens]KZN89318.1 Zinc finger protein [Penicillium chrysogenum]
MSKRPRSRSRPPSLDQDSVSVSSITVNTTTPPPERNKLIDSDTNILPEVMHCSLPPHRETLSFTSYEDYEVHYLQSHVNRCSECSKNFPTGHFLNIHIEENHDPLAAARRARGDKTTYNFYIVNDGIDKQTSMLRPMNSHRRRISTSSALEGRLRRRSSASQSNPPATAIPETKSSNEMDIDELEKSMSALKFVPTSVSRNRNKVSGK